MAKKIRAQKLGKLEGQKVVGINADFDDEGVYIELTRANGNVEKAALSSNYILKAYGQIIAMH